MYKQIKNITLISLSLGLAILGNSWFSPVVKADNSSPRLAGLPKVGTPAGTIGGGVRGADNNAAIIREQWGLTLVECRGPVVSILYHTTEYCAKPTKDLKIGKYVFVPKGQNNQESLEPLFIYKPQDVNLNIIQKLQLESIDCNVAQPVVAIMMGNKQYCAKPNQLYGAGNYLYNSETKSLQPAGNN